MPQPNVDLAGFERAGLFRVAHFAQCQLDIGDHLAQRHDRPRMTSNSTVDTKSMVSLPPRSGSSATNAAALDQRLELVAAIVLPRLLAGSGRPRGDGEAAMSDSVRTSVRCTC